MQKKTEVLEGQKKQSGSRQFSDSSFKGLYAKFAKFENAMSSHAVSPQFKWIEFLFSKLKPSFKKIEIKHTKRIGLSNIENR